MKEFGVVRIFLAILKNSTNKKVRKLQKLIKEVQKKKKQNRKKQKAYDILRSAECAHRK